MLKTYQKNKLLFTIVISSIIIVLGLLGSKWQLGYAEDEPTIPTLPFVYDYEPKEICINSIDPVVTVFGPPESFITPEYTWIKWLDATNEYSYIVPDEIINGVLKFTVDPPKLTQVYTAYFWIENHPPDSDEIYGAFPIEIIGCNNIFLPLVMK